MGFIIYELPVHSSELMRNFKLTRLFVHILPDTRGNVFNYIIVNRNLSHKLNISGILGN